MLADTLGELQYLYGAANISFIGGSLIRRGGHNPLEFGSFFQWVYLPALIPTTLTMFTLN